ncbi:MAG: RHS repeat-associated core domain-containing protein [Pirellulales bacterium]
MSVAKLSPTTATARSLSKPSRRRRPSSVRSRKFRSLWLESLESRRMFAVDWRNPVDSLDVDGSGQIVPLDALEIINRLNSSAPNELPDERDPALPFWDVTGDQFVAPIDALFVINHINSVGSGLRRLEEGALFARQSDVTITLGQPAGARTVRFELTAEFDVSDAAPALEDLLAVYLVDEEDAHQTLLDRGTPGTSLFSWSNNQVEAAAGTVRWDGEVLEIDTSSIVDRDTGVLRFQLLNNDSDLGTRVTIRPLSNEVDPAATPRFALAEDATTLAPGAPLSLGALPLRNDVQLEASNVRFNRSTGRYVAEVNVLNQGESLGRELAVAFPNLPVGVSLANASGATPSGAPYVNMQDAIGRGGLVSGSRSAALLVEFDNPLNIPFSLVPEVRAASNQAPTLAPIGALQAVPGEVLVVDLQASDPNGDSLQYWLDFTTPLPTSTLDSDGRLVFYPGPDEVGVYQFTAIASDGSLRAEVPVTLEIVADPVTTSRVTGRVLKVDGSPLAGMPVELGAVQGLTDAAGNFTLDLGAGPIVGDTLRIRGELYDGPEAYPFIAERLELVLEHPAYPGVNNVIARPIYLPALDLENGGAIDPQRDTLVTTDALPGAAVFVAAGTLMNQQGSPFEGVLSITEVPTDRTPAALPDGLLPDLVVTIQPGEMVFAQPAPLTLPNPTGYVPGTLMDLWSINPVTGDFEVVGTGRVSDDGSVIETIEGGIRNSSWHFFLWVLYRTFMGVDDAPCETCKPSGPARSTVDFHTGAITEQMFVGGYGGGAGGSLGGGGGGVSLVYNSLRASGRTAVSFESSLACVAFAGFEPPQQRFFARLSATRGKTSFHVASRFWTLPDCSGAGSTRMEAGLIGDLSGFNSGEYQLELKTGVLTRGADGATAGALTTTSAPMIFVNYVTSPFGAGWGIAGVQEIIENPNGSATLIDGDGTTITFGPPLALGQPYQSPPGDFSRLEKLGDGTFRRTLKDQTVYQFNSDNRLVTVTDRNNNHVEYRYDQGLLSEIVDTVGLTTRFVYLGGRLNSIIDPYGRTTRVAHDDRGNLIRITDPIGNETSWEYDALHAPTSMTDANGNYGEDRYSVGGRSIGSEFPDGSTSTVRPGKLVGISASETNTEWEAAIPIPTDRVALYTDVNGNTIRMRLDSLGQPIEISDDLGPIASVVRNEDNLVVHSTDGRGNIVRYEYDDRGNLTLVADSISDSLPAPSVYWISSTGGDWHDPANWSTGVVPGPEDDVLIEIPGVDAEIVVGWPPTSVHRLYSFEKLTIDTGTLTLSGDSQLSQTLTTRLGGQLRAEGVEANIAIDGAIAEGAAIYAEQGAVVTLTSVNAVDNLELNIALGAQLRAPQLKNLDDAFVTLSAGGSFDASVLESIDGSSFVLSGPTTEYVLPNSVTLYRAGADLRSRYLQAEDGALLDLSSLTTLEPNVSFFDLQIAATQGGRLRLPNVTAISDQTFYVTVSGDTSVLDVSGLSEFVDSTITLNDGGQFVTPNLTRIDGASFLLSGANTSYTAPAAATSYLPGPGAFERMLKVDDGATLDLSAISIIESSVTSYSTRIYVFGGGTLLVPNIASFTDYSGEIRAEGAGSRIDLSGLTTWTGSETVVGERAALVSGAGSTIVSPLLTSLANVDLYVSGAGSLTTSQLTEFQHGSMNIADREIDLSGITELVDIRLTLQNQGSVFTPNLTNIDGSSFHLRGAGTSYSLPAAITSYHPGPGIGHREFLVEQQASLDLSSLTSIWPVADGFSTSFYAYSGGTLLLPHVAAFTDNSVGIHAEGDDSLIDLSGLTSWMGRDVNSGRRSSLNSVAGSTIDAPLLTELQNVDIVATGTGTLSTSQIEQLQAGGLAVTGREVDLSGLEQMIDGTVDLREGGNILAPNLIDIDGTSFALRGAGTSFTLPAAITTYQPGPSVGHRFFQVEELASLDLSSLTSITPVADGFSTSFNAYSGGTLLLPNVPAFTDNSVGVYAEGAGSHIDLSALASWTGRDVNSGLRSSLSSLAGSTIDAPLLTSLQNVDIVATGVGSLSTAQIEQLQRGGLAVTERDVDLSGLEQMIDVTVDLREGGSLLTPNLVDIDGSSFSLRGVGTSYTLPAAITTYQPGPGVGHRFFQVEELASLDLSSLTSITPVADGFSTSFNAYSGGTLLLPNVPAFTDNSVGVYAEGVGSHIDLSALASWTGRDVNSGLRSSLISLAGSTIDAPLLTSLQNVDVVVTGDGMLSTSQIELLQRGGVTVTEREVDLSGLEQMIDVTVDLRDGGSLLTPNLVDIDGSSFSLRGASTSYTLPAAITTYQPGPGVGHRFFQVEELASLDLSSLTSITPVADGFSTSFYAFSGGTLLLPNVPAFTDNSVGAYAEGVGSRIDLSALTSWTGRDVNSGHTSTLASRAGATIDLGNLTTLSSVYATFDDSSGFPLAQITHWQEGSLSFEGGEYEFTQLVDADNTNLTIDGAIVRAPVLTNIGAGAITITNGGSLVAPLLPGFGGSGGEGDDGSGDGGDGETADGQSGGGSSPAPAGGGDGESGDGNNGDGESPLPEVPTPRPRTFTYDPVFSQLTSATDELGRLTLFTLGPANGNVLEMRRVVGQIDAISGESDDQVSTYTYAVRGLLDTYTDPRGIVTDWDYDALDRVIQVTVAVGTPAEAVWLTEYDAFGRVAAEIDPNGNRTEYGYDALDRVTLVRDALGHVTQYAYDSKGNLTRLTDPTGAIWRFRYDRRDRLIETEDPLQQKTIYGYDRGGNLVRVTDPLGHITRFEYDVRGRRTATIDPDGGVTRFEYDLDNNLTALIDPVGNRTTFDYDARSRQIRETDPLGNAIVYTYDAVDNLIAKLDRNGRTTTFAYDSLDRLVAETWVGGGNEIHYTYDANDNLLTVQDVFSSLTYAYDEQNRPTSVDNAGTPGAPHVVLDYTYDAVGNVLSVVDAISGQPGATTSYAYDALHRLSSLSQTGPTVADKRVDFTYNEMGQYEHVRRYSDLAATQLVIDTEYTYDVLSRLATIDHRNSAAEAVSFFHYTYDAASRITGINEIDGAVAYGYDDRDQLISAAYTNPERPDEFYQYDANGNREASYLHGDGYLTGPANRLLSDGTYNYEYDLEGNTVRRTEIATGDYREFHWDHRNRLTAVIDRTAAGVATQIVEFTYDALGRRIAKSVDATPADAVDAAITHFVYDREDVLLDFVDEDGAGAGPTELAMRYLHGAGIDEVLSQEGAERGTEWLLVDHLGSTRDVIDSQGTHLQYLSYDSYGNVVIDTETDVDSRMLFTGREWDEETGQYYFRTRHYSPRLGSFLKEDLARNQFGEWNLRIYVINSPIGRSDPFGLWYGWDDAAFAAGGAVLGIVGQGISDVYTGQLSDTETYIAAGLGGALGGWALLYTGPVGAGVTTGAMTNLIKQTLWNLNGKICTFDWESLFVDTAIGGLTGLIPGMKIPGITSGRGSMNQVFKQMVTKAKNGTSKSIRPLTAVKMFAGRSTATSLVPGMAIGTVGSVAYYSRRQTP